MEEKTRKTKKMHVSLIKIMFTDRGVFTLVLLSVGCFVLSYQSLYFLIPACILVILGWLMVGGIKDVLMYGDITQAHVDKGGLTIEIISTSTVLKFKYSFVVNDKEYTNEYNALGFSSPVQKGDVVDVCYDPEDPDNNYLPILFNKNYKNELEANRKIKD